ncbi:MAG: hypothetical protein C4320_03620 [Armatimonadota bacterium]
MKNPIPAPVFALIGIAYVVVIAFFFIRYTSGPPEFAEPKRAPNYEPGIPDYITNRGSIPVPGAPGPDQMRRGPGGKPFTGEVPK